MANSYQAPSVKKAFQILELISERGGNLGISELSHSLGIGKSTVHGITSALEEIGAIRRDPSSKKYTLGFTLFELGRLAYALNTLKDLARPVLEQLMEKARESVFLGGLNGDRATILDIVESRQDLRIIAQVGTTIPLTAAATGKVFLAGMEEQKALEILRKAGMKRYTEYSITDPEEYLQEIRRVREQGYATDYEEYILGVRAVAFPIEGENLRSAIWVVGFKTSLDDERMKAVIEATREAAEEIHRRVLHNR
jgi:DNA-binding IclR family transcriptional regulator